MRFSPLRAEQLGAWLDSLGRRPLAAVIFSTTGADVIPQALRELRKRPQHRTTRAFLAAPDERVLPPDGSGELDVEDVVTAGSLRGTRGLASLLERGVRGHRDAEGPGLVSEHRVRTIVGMPTISAGARPAQEGALP